MVWWRDSREDGLPDKEKPILLRENDKTLPYVLVLKEIPSFAWFELYDPECKLLTDNKDTFYTPSVLSEFEWTYLP